VATTADLIKLVEIIAGAFKTAFSAAKAFVVVKFTAFGIAIAAISAGLHIRGSGGTRHAAGWGNFELELSESNTLQVLAVVAVFVFALVANVYCLNKSREHEIRLRELEMKAPPSLRRKLHASTKKRNRRRL
jgi:hypothetical protein